MSSHKNEARRIVPAAYLATGVVGVLFVLELVVLSGALELNPATVADFAPWAYDPFLKLIGEHPSQFTEAQSVSTNSVVTVAGFDPETLSITLDAAEGITGTNVVIEPTVPLYEEELEDEPLDPEDVVPVG